MSREAHVRFWESAEVKSLRATRLWQYGTPGGAAIFEFRMGRGREGPLRFLGDFEGILQTGVPGDRSWSLGWRRTPMRPTTVLADRRWCTRLVGRMPEESLTRRSSSTSRTSSRRGSWCRWESCFRSTPRRGTNTWTMLDVTRCAWNGLRWCSPKSRRRSRQQVERHCLRVRSAGLRTTQYGCRRSSRAFLTIPSWNYRITSPRTPCAPSRLVAATGRTWDM